MANFKWAQFGGHAPFVYEMEDENKNKTVYGVVSFDLEDESRLALVACSKEDSETPEKCANSKSRTQVKQCTSKIKHNCSDINTKDNTAWVRWAL